MNKGHFWTKLEDEAVLSLDWPTFNEKFNGSYEDEIISYNAYRFRKAKLLQEAATTGTTGTDSSWTIKDFNVSINPSSLSITMPQNNASFVGLTHAFFDIETTFSTQPRVLSAAIADCWGNVEVFRLDDPQYAGESWIDDSVLVKKYIQRLRDYDIVVGWNSKLFDIPVLNGRVLKWISLNKLQKHDMWEHDMHIDLMYYATGQFARIGRRSLDSVSTYLGTTSKKTPLNPDLHDRADHGDMAAYEELVHHNYMDVLTTREVYGVLKHGIVTIHR